MTKLNEIYDANKDGSQSYDLAIAAIRERRVRNGDVVPDDDNERRQALEGPREINELDCLTK